MIVHQQAVVVKTLSPIHIARYFPCLSAENQAESASSWKNRCSAGGSAQATDWTKWVKSRETGIGCSPIS